jgi:hypothetical protein
LLVVLLAALLVCILFVALMLPGAASPLDTRRIQHRLQQ